MMGTISHSGGSAQGGGDALSNIAVLATVLADPEAARRTIAELNAAQAAANEARAKLDETRKTLDAKAAELAGKEIALAKKAEELAEAETAYAGKASMIERDRIKLDGDKEGLARERQEFAQRQISERNALQTARSEFDAEHRKLVGELEAKAMALDGRVERLDAREQEIKTRAAELKAQEEAYARRIERLREIVNGAA